MDVEQSLVERLRSVDISWSETGEWCAEAAAEIERLTAENAKLRGEYDKLKSAIIRNLPPPPVDLEWLKRQYSNQEPQALDDHIDLPRLHMGEGG